MAEGEAEEAPVQEHAAEHHPLDATVMSPARLWAIVAPAFAKIVQY